MHHLSPMASLPAPVTRFSDSDQADAHVAAEDGTKLCSHDRFNASARATARTLGPFFPSFQIYSEPKEQNMQIADFDSQLINNCMQMFLPARGRRRFRIERQQPIFFMRRPFCLAFNAQWLRRATKSRIGTEKSTERVFFSSPKGQPQD